MKSAPLWLIGGICAGVGILLAANGGFGMEAGPTSTIYSQLGYDGLDNLQITNKGFAALGSFVVGVALLVTANAGAWRQTGGY